MKSRNRASIAVFACIVLMAAIGCPRNAAGQAAGTDAYAKAESLLHDRQWDSGLELLLPLLKGSPDNQKLLNLVGLAYSGKGDLTQGSTYFRKALELNPSFLPALKNLAVNELHLGEIKAAESHLLAAEEKAPDDPVIQMYLGELSYSHQDYKKTAEHLQHARVLNSGDPQLLACLAISYLKTGRKQGAAPLLNALHPEELATSFQLTLGVALAEADTPAQAIVYLEAARRAHPTSPEIEYDLGICYIAAGQNPQAISVLQDLIQQGNETAEINNLLAEAYEKNRETQHAVDAYRRAIALAPDDEDNYLDFASLCLNHQAFSNASKVLLAALAVHPASSRLIFERGILEAMQDHFDAAEKDFQSSAELAPQTDSGYVALGITYIEQGNTAQAIQVLRKRIAEHPRDANLFYLLGEALIRSGAAPGDPSFAEAQSMLEKSISLDADLCEPHATLGTIYLKQGKLQQAVDQLEQARSIDPSDKSSYSHLAVAYRRMGQLDKAKQMISSLQAINDNERDGPKQAMKSQVALPVSDAHSQGQSAPD